MASSSPAGKVNLHDSITREDDSEKVPASLRRALTLLQLDDLGDVEQQFLATDAFLKPWSVFRDSIFLLQPNAMPRATLINTTASGSGSGITRLDLLWYFTQFDEDTLRYDPRADRSSLEYTPDSTMHGVINKYQWTTENHEKHFYAWLLQEFRVGKANNAWGFNYFELRSVCTVWEEVLVPIMNAVRASYSSRGRRYYGRLALFVEARCPSRLAFPEDNVGGTEAELLSPTPFRIVSVPRKMIGSNGATFTRTSGSIGVLTKKHYDQTEMELRDVYPQYGGLVERPKFKRKMEEWLAEQRVRAERRKAAEKHGDARSGQPQIADEYAGRPPRRQVSRTGGTSPVKRYSDSIRRSLSRTMSKGHSKDQPNSPLHGVARQLVLPDDTPAMPSRPTSEVSPTAKRESSTKSIISPPSELTSRSTPKTPRRPSAQSVYTSIRNSNPFAEGVPEIPPAPRTRVATESALLSDCESSHISDEYYQTTDRDNHAVCVPGELHSVHAKKSFGDVRIPSYEGTDYVDEISPSKLHTARGHAVTTLDSTRIVKAPTRLPGPIQATPYARRLNVASKDSSRLTPPEPLQWAGEAQYDRAITLRSSSPKVCSGPGIDDLAPRIPMKSPERLYSKRAHVSNATPARLMLEKPGNMLRIVSKENIRAALGGDSRESSHEDLGRAMAGQYAEGGAKTMISKGGRLPTYNTHLFPRSCERKGTPVGGWVNGLEKRSHTQRSFEMASLERDAEGQT